MNYTIQYYRNSNWFTSQLGSFENIEKFAFSTDLYRLKIELEYSPPFNKDNIWIAECWLAEIKGY